MFVFVSIGFLLISNFAFTVYKQKFGTLRFTAVIISFFLLPLQEPSSFVSTPISDGFYHLSNTTSSHSFDTLVYTGMVLQAAALPKGAKVEIEAVAIVGNISDA